MSGADEIFAFPPQKLKKPPLQQQVEAEPKKPAMVLDMGEASREEGFRLNGCR